MSKNNDVFFAALTGILANPAFYGAVMQGSPEAAIDAARKIANIVQSQRPVFNDAGPRGDR